MTRRKIFGKKHGSHQGEGGKVRGETGHVFSANKNAAFGEESSQTQHRNSTIWLPEQVKKGRFGQDMVPYVNIDSKDRRVGPLRSKVEKKFGIKGRRAARIGAIGE